MLNKTRAEKGKKEKEDMGREEKKADNFYEGRTNNLSKMREVPFVNMKPTH